MLCRAGQCVYWPGIGAQVETKARQCQACEVHAPSQPTEVLQLTPPQYSLQQMGGSIPVRRWLTSPTQTGSRLAGGGTHFRGGHQLPPRHCFPSLLQETRLPRGVVVRRRHRPPQTRVHRLLRRLVPRVKDLLGTLRLSDGRSEAKVQSANWLLKGNISPWGSVASDGVARTLMQHVNTPLHLDDHYTNSPPANSESEQKCTGH